ncbi:MAG TPA: lipase maturation factor family protein [Kofleriaceae bacterium]|nr:lipase maturation factor family protein [Kofleriaceae bacterium]
MKPVLVFDGECGFCRDWVERWRARTGDRVDYVPLQQPGVLQRLGIPRSDALRSVQLVTPDGNRFGAADAVFRTVEYAPELRHVARFGRLPLLRTIANFVYRQIAIRRGLAASVDRLLVGKTTRPPDSRLVRNAFMRALGGVYLIAFASLGRQVKGLYGRRGIEPIDDFLQFLRKRVSKRERLTQYPTVFWLDSSDAALVRACRAGEVGGALMMLGIAPRTTAAVLWLLYLSFVSVGRDFLAFQWDVLLLENGLHALVLAPSRNNERPPWAAVALMRLLAFRLQFESGHCKLASGDKMWRSGDACCVHFETQPLPTRGGWYAHQAPRQMKRATTYAVLALELGAPWLALLPRRLRHTSFALLVGLQILIAATGNYGFFNLLTIVDNLWFLDDAVLARTAERGRQTPRWRRLAITLAALPIAAISISRLVSRVFRRGRIPKPVRTLEDRLSPLRSVSSYGLFAVMTTERPEIVIEGSDDAVTWREYGFRYKPGDLKRPPRWAAPHQPRLDWQMWFAALGPAPSWFYQLLERLLEGAPDVLALFEHNPFPDHAPKYVRALLYDYHFTDRATQRREGTWWRRDLLGAYVPIVELADRRR